MARRSSTRSAAEPRLPADLLGRDRRFAAGRGARPSGPRARACRSSRSGSTTAPATARIASPAHWLDALTPPIAPHLDYLGDTRRAICSRRRGAAAAADRAAAARSRAAAAAANWLPIALAGAAGRRRDRAGGGLCREQPDERDADDRARIGAAVDEMYAMISGPKGPRDWSRQANCFHPDARQIRTWLDADGRPAMQDHEPRRLCPRHHALLRRRTISTRSRPRRRIDLFGNIAHVWSAYEARSALDDAEPERRGINSIQLFRDPERGWRIMAMLWDNEREGVTLPAFE